MTVHAPHSSPFPFCSLCTPRVWCTMTRMAWCAVNCTMVHSNSHSDLNSALHGGSHGRTRSDSHGLKPRRRRRHIIRNGAHEVCMHASKVDGTFGVFETTPRPTEVPRACSRGVCQVLRPACPFLSSATTVSREQNYTVVDSYTTCQFFYGQTLIRQFRCSVHFFVRSARESHASAQRKRAGSWFRRMSCGSPVRSNLTNNTRPGQLYAEALPNLTAGSAV